MDRYTSDEINGVFVTRLYGYECIYCSDIMVYVSEDGMFFTETPEGIYKDTTLKGLKQQLKSRAFGEKIIAYQVLTEFVHFAPIVIYHYEGRYVCPDAPNILKSLVILSEEELKKCEMFKIENKQAYERYLDGRREAKLRWKEFAKTLKFVVPQW